MSRIIQFKHFMLFLALVSISISAFAQFAGGSGTEADPWLIANRTQLELLHNYLGVENTDKYFRQIADIDLNGSPWNPVGRINPFYGNYNGNGRLISNITFTDYQSGPTGLFANVQDASLNNIYLTNVSVNINQVFGSEGGTIENIGSLTAMCVNSTIQNCHTNSAIILDVTNANVNNISGFVAQTDNSCQVSYSSSEGYVSVFLRNDPENPGIINYSANAVAGMFAVNRGQVSQCFNIASVSVQTAFSPDPYAPQLLNSISTGGLCGVNYGSIFQCYQGNGFWGLVGRNLVGGICGANFGMITESVSQSDVTATDTYGGFVGYGSFAGATDCLSMSTTHYFGNPMNAPGSHGTFFGSWTGMGGVSNSLAVGYNTDQYDSYGVNYNFGGYENYTIDCYADNPNTQPYGEGLKYPYDPALNAYNMWNFWSIWEHDYDHSVNGGYPYLRWQTQVSNAYFVYDYPPVSPAGTVQFIDRSRPSPTAGTIQYLWDFGDGLSSTQQNPLHTYAMQGDYTVVLTISNVHNNSATYSQVVHVQRNTSDFSATPLSGNIPLTVQFTDETNFTVETWAWDFNSDGIIDSTEPNPIWTFLFPGVFDVTLIASNQFSSDTRIKEDYIAATLDPAHTLHVPAQFSTIQAAIDASSNGDYILVADGTYYENLLIEGKNITLGSHYFIDGDTLHIANTIIDGGNALNPDQASTITILPGGGRPDTTPHVIGFTIRNGSGRRILQNIGGNTIEKRVGGGIYIRQAKPMFSYNKIEDNDADDEGGGSYAFQSIPNLGGMENAAIGKHNPGGNKFLNNHADLGADFYIQGSTGRDIIQLQNCEFEVFSQTENTVSNYWVNASTPLDFNGCSGQESALSLDLYVAPNGSDSMNSGISPDSPFKTIDHALSRILATSSAPLTIHLAPGTYSPSLTGERFPLQMVDHVSLQGAGRNETWLDAEANVDFPKRVLNLDNTQGVQISGLTLMGGFVTLSKNYNGGGIGIINSSLDLNDVLLSGNSSAGDGAGIYAYQSVLNVDELQIEYNAALGSGGGIYSKDSSLNLTDSSLRHNSVSRNGAGIFADTGSTTIQNCVIEANQATGSQSKGGGICLTSTLASILRANTIRANSADNGAAIFLQNNTNISLDRNLISGNEADFQGAGIFVNTGSGLFSNNLIANNTAGQNGGGLYCQASPQMTNNTIVNNLALQKGGGLYLYSGNPLQQNSIYWGNVAGALPNQLFLYTEEADPDFAYCDVQGGSAGFALSPGLTYSGAFSACLDVDPLFQAPSSSAGAAFNFPELAYALQDNSPCVDAGQPGFDPALTPLDLAGNPRIDNNRIDLGAYEAVHYNGARIAVSPSALDFGRININAAAAQETLTLTNIGNQPLLISGLNLQNPDSVFSWSFTELNVPLQPGASVNLQVSCLPLLPGEISNVLEFVNNSLNSPLLSIPLRAYGIDASSSQPSNINLQIVGYDVHLSWNPVLSDPEGNPFSPEGYIVLYHENPQASLDEYLYLTFSTGTSAIHPSVARFRERMFYWVIAIDGETRARLENLLATGNRTGTLTWKELQKLLP